ncbi:MAG: YjbQ family protein [Desulfobacteraceae bacterium]|nr:MAG: YjbQ family protein [Desulfobacteraceae bacterium]
MRTTITLKTHAQTEMIDITRQVQQTIDDHRFQEGLCMLYVPHTTAAVTINENADPTVREDLLMVLNRIVPWKADYRHMEGNSPAHVKASLIGASALIQVEDGRLVLGTWQGVFFCEFDGPRTRKINVALVSVQ